MTDKGAHNLSERNLELKICITRPVCCELNTCCFVPVCNCVNDAKENKQVEHPCLVNYWSSSFF